MAGNYSMEFSVCTTCFFYTLRIDGARLKNAPPPNAAIRNTVYKVQQTFISVCEGKISTGRLLNPSRFSQED